MKKNRLEMRTEAALGFGPYLATVRQELVGVLAGTVGATAAGL
jgi:hypothetical protein